MSPWGVRTSAEDGLTRGRVSHGTVRHARGHPDIATLAGERGLRTALGSFATGVTVATVGTDPPHGMTANAFTSVSLDPPLVLLCVRHGSATHSAIADLGAFAVSVLAADQAVLARRFADPLRPRDHTQFDGAAWCPGPRTGAPLLVHALAWLECQVTEHLDGGDHSVFLATVLDSGRGTGRDPLVFHRSGYHRLAPPSSTG